MTSLAHNVIIREENFNFIFDYSDIGVVRAL